MALKLYLGCSGSGKSHSLYEHIIDESLVHPELTYLIIVPEQYNLSTQRQLISRHPKKGILNIDVLSFTRLAHRVFEEVGYRGAKGATIDDIGKNLILKHLAGRNEDKLTVLSGMCGKLGYISEVKSVISEFMQYGIGDRELENIINKSSSRGILKAKLTDVRLLYGEFLKYINEKYITTEEILEKVRDEVARSEKLKKSVIVFDGYTGFTPVQLGLIKELLINCVDVYMTILCDPGMEGAGIKDARETDLFYLSRKTRESLDRICRENGIGLHEDVMLTDSIPARFRYDRSGEELPEDKRSKELIFLERNVFRDKTAVFDASVNDHNIHIFMGTDPLEEAYEAAVRIQRLVREEGYRFGDIAVVSGDIGTYMNACGRAFKQYGIPFFIDKTREIMLNPLIEYIRSLFDIMTEDYSYEAIFRYLKSRMTGYDPMDTDILENYVLKYGIKGRRAWNEPFVLRENDEDEGFLEKLNMIRRKVADEIDVFRKELGTDGDADVRVISTALYRFMSVHNLNSRMDELSAELEKKGDPVRAREYGKIYEEVCILLDKMVRLLPGEIISLKEYRELLDAGFAEIRTGVIPDTDDHVQVGDITRTRLTDVKALFFMGVNDGIVPSSAGRGGMLTDMDREFITGSNEGIELAPTSRMQGFIQHLYLYMLTTKPSGHLYISYAGLTEDGDSVSPSYFVDTVKRMFPEIKTEYPDTSFANRVYDPASGYVWLGREAQDVLYRAADNKRSDYHALLSWLMADEAYVNRIRVTLEGALKGSDRDKSDVIGSAVAKALYGEELTGSVTRLENYARCAYSHFLKYGLKLKERELFSFEARDIGSVFHDTIQAYSDVLKEKGLKWAEADEDTRVKLIDEAIERCIAKNDYMAIYGSFRTKYTINRMRRILKRSVDTLTEHLEKGSFEPYGFEVKFNTHNRPCLYGRIDRMDICEDDDAVYVKIIDYKSGIKTFDLAAVYAGLDLQLTVYMRAGCDMIADKYPGKQVKPAGMFYYHIDDPLIADDTDAGMSSEEIDRAVMKKLKLNGLVNSEEKVFRLIDSEFEKKSDIIPVSIKKEGGFGQGSHVASEEEFGIISNYVNQKIYDMGNEILNGNVKAEPHIKDGTDKGPCKYCDYSGICGYRGKGSIFDPDTEEDEPDDDHASYREDRTVTENKIIEAMKSAIDAHDR
ncbi:MAG: PD-(D/E)XK nuclease family protein [Lachnospiraceae bacterium]|nr:PD-(D/E)XK nuclease family protein [Lachnospiraceae bacterium]